MIDIHSHLIFDVDDGPKTLDESLRMVCEAEEAGVKTIIATPHFREHMEGFEKVIENFQKLAHKASDSGVAIKLGCEVMLNPLILKNIDDRTKLCLDNSDYMLFEFPPGLIPSQGHDVIYRLQLEGIVPIIAHPERNICFLKDSGLLLEFIERGCLVQVDAGSIIGIYGKKIRDFSKSLIELNLTQFVASDAHTPHGYSDCYVKAYQTVSLWVGEEKANVLFAGNAATILDNGKDNARALSEATM